VVAESLRRRRVFGALMTIRSVGLWINTKECVGILAIKGTFGFAGAFEEEGECLK
jgi:hypothetical protein